MALNNSNADSVATAFCAANAIVDATAIAKWKSLIRLLYSGNAGSLVSAITATLPPSSVVTVGSATTQTGPAAPVTIVVS